MAIKRDISGRILLEQKMCGAQRMESIGRLAGGVAHDFNNLLQAIMGYGELALMKTESDSDLHGELDQILTAGQRATVLVKQLLAFSRRQVLQLEDMRLQNVVEELSDMLRRLIGEHITLSVRSSSGAVNIRADQGQIEQVLVNLCVNARDAIVDGGEIVLSVESALLTEDFCENYSWASPGSFALLTVSDTGCGMNEETLSHIFEPFYSTKPTEEGTGLGLATVYGIIKQHNGFIEVNSELNKGTTFRIYLPTIEKASVHVEDEGQGSPPSGTETILLAEDETTVLEWIAYVLNSAGYRVMTAENGLEALKIFDAHTDEIDLLLLDVVMPELGGQAVLQHARERRPEIPVLLSSGYAGESGHTDFVLEEGTQMLNKPYDQKTLLWKLRELLDG